MRFAGLKKLGDHRTQLVSVATCLLLTLSAIPLGVRLRSDLRSLQRLSKQSSVPNSLAGIICFRADGTKLAITFPQNESRVLLVPLRGVDLERAISFWEKGTGIPATQVIGVCSDAKCIGRMREATAKFPIVAYVNYAAAVTLAYYYRRDQALLVDRAFGIKRVISASFDKSGTGGRQ